MNAIALTNVGKTRENNEDFYAIYEDLNLFIVADGMGGYLAGEVASELASKAILEAYKERQISDDFNFERDIEVILAIANDRILDYVKDHPECRGMGTTVVVAYFDNNQLWIANVGDSRCYGLTENIINQLSQDHSLVAELVKIGSISLEEAEIHPDRNIITSALGVDRKFEVFTSNFNLSEYKYIMLCTDGLTNMVSAKDQLDIFLANDFENVPNALIELANQNGGKDNITVICIEL